MLATERKLSDVVRYLQCSHTHTHSHIHRVVKSVFVCVVMKCESMMWIYTVLVSVKSAETHPFVI